MRLVLIDTNDSGDEENVRYAWLEDLCLDLDASAEETLDLVDEFDRIH